MDKKKIIKYLAITFGITYTFWWGLALLTKLNIVSSSSAIYTLMHVVGGFGPTIAAICVLPKRKPKDILHFVFDGKKHTYWYLLLFCAIQFAVIGLSSGETNPQLPWFAAPIVLISATIVGGGNEELGWRGILQPELQKKFSFPISTLITGCIWMSWHIPLWFVVGTSQQGINFALYCVYGLILSTWLATLHKITGSVFACTVFHGFSNLTVSLFVIKINFILVVGLIAALALSVWLYYHEKKEVQ